MEALSNSLCHHNNLAGLLAKNSQDGLNLQSGILSRTRAKAELEITTAEGDRVTLFSQSKVKTAYASYDSQGKLMGAESSGTTEMYSIISTNKVAISVEGDLNEEELADIQNLLQKVENLFMNFLTEGGNIEDSMMSSISLDSMKTLSNFDAELKYSQKIAGFGVVSGSSNQISDSAADQESAPAESSLDSETSDNANPEVTTIAFKSKMKASMHLSGTRLIMEEPAQLTPTDSLPDAGVAENLPAATETTVSNPATNSVSMMSLEANMRSSVKVKVVQTLVEPAQAQPETPQEPVAPEQTLTDGTSTPLPTDNITAVPNQVTDTSAANTGTLSSVYTFRMKLVEEFASFMQSSTIGLNRLAPVISQFIPKMMEQLNDDYIMSENQKQVVQQTGDDVLNTFQNVAP